MTGPQTHANDGDARRVANETARRQNQPRSDASRRDNGRGDVGAERPATASNIARGTEERRAGWAETRNLGGSGRMSPLVLAGFLAVFATLFPAAAHAQPITVGYDPLVYEVGEGDGSVRLTIRISQPTSGGSPRAFTLSVGTSDRTARSPGDYGGISGQLIPFQAGDISKSHTITINDDTIDDPDEFFKARISLFSGSDVTIDEPTATVTIIDNNDGPVKLDTTLTVGQAGYWNATLGCSSTSNYECDEGMGTREFVSVSPNRGGKDFRIDGLTVTRGTSLLLWFIETRLREYEMQNLVLELDDVEFPFSDAVGGAYHVRRWENAGLNWRPGDTVRVRVLDPPGSGGQQQEPVLAPLTATFENMPSGHDGSSAFTFRLAFSDEVTIEPAAMRDHALVVSGAAVTAASRVDGRNDLWEFTLQPSGNGAVSILAPLNRACTETGALCTSDGRQLSTAAGQVVTGPPQGQGQQTTPLTVAFQDLPTAHDGSSVFTFRLAFSEGIKTSFRVLRDDALSATGGTVKRARRVDQRSDLREIHVEPSGNGAVTVSLGPSGACGSTGAICTEDDRALSNAISATILGPAGLSVTDAEVEEAANAVLAFAVTLDRAASSTVTVDYATSDGTATAGNDYTGTTGTLTFAVGETAKTVSVAVLDDAHDESQETMTLSLSNPSGAYLVDAEATGTIKNQDPLPRALLARFGRTAAVHVVEHVEERLQAPREPGFRGEFAGRELQRGMERDLALNFLSQLGGGAGNPAGAGLHGPMGAAPGGGGMGPLGMPGLGNSTPMAVAGGPMGAASALGATAGPIGVAGGPDGGLNGRGFLQMGLGGGDLLTSSSVAMNRETRNGGILSFWSRGAQSHFAGREGALSLGGQVRTTMFGADYAKGPLVAGLSLSNSRGLGEYAGVAGGQVASAVTGLYPWLGYKATDRVTVWGVAGYGAGGLMLTPAGGPALESGLAMAMAAAGTRGELLTGGASSFALAFKADALWVGTSIDGVDGPGGRLAATEAAVTRFRTGLEGSRDYALVGGRLLLRPSVEVGLRQDGGDAETGAGMDVGSGLVVSDSSTGLSVDVRLRTLLVHQAEGFSERGMALSLSWNPTPSTPLGLTARVAPSWGGQAMSGAGALWGRETMAGMAHGGYAQGNRLDGEVGYGLPVGSRFVGTPRVGFSTSEYGRDYRLGYGLGVLNRESLNVELGVDAQRRESPTQGGANTGVLGRARVGW